MLDYKVRNPRSATFTEYALKHLRRLLGKAMAVALGRAGAKVALNYQNNTARAEKAFLQMSDMGRKRNVRGGWNADTTPLSFSASWRGNGERASRAAL